MPKIFVLRHQLAEQQAKLRQHDKGGESNSGSPSLSSDEEKFEPTASKSETVSVVVQPPVLGGLGVAPVNNPLQPQQPEVSDILQRPPPGLVIQPIPPPQAQTSSPSTSTETAGKKILDFIYFFSKVRSKPL